MFLSSTRLTLMPQGSVASSRIERIRVFIMSRLVRHWSSSSAPMIFLKVVAERFSIATEGFFYAIGKELRIGNLIIDNRIYLHGDVVFCDNGLGQEVGDLLLKRHLPSNVFDKRNLNVKSDVPSCVVCAEPFNDKGICC